VEEEGSRYCGDRKGDGCSGWKAPTTKAEGRLRHDRVQRDGVHFAARPAFREADVHGFLFSFVRYKEERFALACAHLQCDRERLRMFNAHLGRHGLRCRYQSCA